jgi:TetR/AcrR family transcriptional regulator, cholesterol catabolism regulator
MVEEQHQKIEEILNTPANAIKKLLNILGVIETMVREMNPVCHSEMQRFYPKSFHHLDIYKREHMIKSIKENLQQGIDEGLYRENVHIDIIAKYRLESTFMIFQNNIYSISQYDILEVNRQLFAHYLYGIATLKGHKVISKHLK